MMRNKDTKNHHGKMPTLAPGLHMDPFGRLGGRGGGLRPTLAPRPHMYLFGHLGGGGGRRPARASMRPPRTASTAPATPPDVTELNQSSRRR